MAYGGLPLRNYLPQIKSTPKRNNSFTQHSYWNNSLKHQIVVLGKIAESTGYRTKHRLVKFTKVLRRFDRRKVRETERRLFPQF